MRVPVAELKSQQQEHVSNTVKLSNIIHCWINQRTTAVTWNSIITVVKNVKETRIAQKIEAYVLQDDVNDNTSTSSRVSVEEQKLDKSMI